jgi:hypothetical protein
MKDETPQDLPAGAENRRFRRISVEVPGKLFFPADNREEACTVGDLSPGGAAIQCGVRPEIGSQVVLYVDGFGRFEGQVARLGSKGFGIAFTSTANKRERTAEQLTLFLNHALADQPLLTRRERTAHKSFTKFTRADGQVVNCEVMDISVLGVTLRTEVRPVVGEFVLIAGIAGKVVGHYEHGIGIEFVGQEKGSSEAMNHINLVR